MKYIILGDMHLGCRDGNKAIRDHQHNFFYEQLIPYCNSTGIKTIIQLGDMFDSRTAIKHQTMYDAKRLIANFKHNGIDFTTLVGNHDIPNKTDLDYDAATSIIGHDHVISITTNRDDFLIVPWINKSNYEETMSTIKSSKAKYLLGHFDIMGAKFNKYGQASHDGIDPSLFKKFDRVLSGHFHTKSKLANIDYVGTPYEMSWSDWDDKKGFHVIDSDKNELEFIENPDHIFYKVIHDDDMHGVFPHTDSKDFSGKFVKVETTSTDKKAIKSVVESLGGAFDIQTVMSSSEKLNIENLKVSSVSIMIEDSVKSVRSDRASGVLSILKSAMEKVATC